MADDGLYDLTIVRPKEASERNLKCPKCLMTYRAFLCVQPFYICADCGTVFVPKDWLAQVNAKDWIASDPGKAVERRVCIECGKVGARPSMRAHLTVHRKGKVEQADKDPE